MSKLATDPASFPRNHLLGAVALWILVGVLTVGTTRPAQAQTYQVIHSFGGLVDGAKPLAGVTIDQAGNLLGTTYGGGAHGGLQGYGVVYKLAPRGPSWLLTPLYNFQAGQDGAYPTAPPVIASNGVLYGNTRGGAGRGCNQGIGCGTLYELQPMAGICGRVQCYWNESVLYRFTGSSDGGNPVGTLTFDASGNMYGATFAGGDTGAGVAFELARSGGTWTQHVIYSFDTASAGLQPGSTLTFDASGNLFGAAGSGGAHGFGTIYKLTPGGLFGWNISDIFDFDQTLYGAGDLLRDNDGNFFGTVGAGGEFGHGAVFELSPAGSGWNLQVIYSFAQSGIGPGGGLLAMDVAGNLYGTTTYQGAFHDGTVFKLSPSNGSWTYTDLHDFAGGADDGCNPYGSVTLDRNGNLFGTTYNCGVSDNGVVWEITP
jgi:uncharacterized repeat protein (TIGR03803 family)